VPVCAVECNVVQWLEWHSKGNVLLAGAGDGSVWLWQGMRSLCYPLN